MNAATYIPQYEPDFGGDDALAVASYMKSGGWVTEFEKTEELAEKIAAFTGARYAAIVPSGTLGLVASLQALGVGAGDEVVVPNLTMAATATAVAMIGAKPVFADIERQTLTLAPHSVERFISSRTRAVIHVSLNGRAGTLLRTLEICKSRGVALIEDAAQSLGSFAEGRHLGTVGDCGVFSFSSPKIITTGQGGAVVTNDAAVAERLKRLKNFGRASGGEDIYDSIGFNYKFTDLQAVLGLSQMAKLQERMAKKKELYRFYRDGLIGLGEVEWIETDLTSVSPWFVDVVVENREGLRAFLKESGIGTRPMYPALHAQRAFAGLDPARAEEFSVSKEMAQKMLWLPSSFSVTDRDVARVCGEIRRFYGDNPH